MYMPGMVGYTLVYMPGMVEGYTLVYMPGYTPWVHHAASVTSVLPGTPSPTSAVPGEGALGSDSKIIRREGASAQREIPFLLDNLGDSAQSYSGLPGIK